jgi:dihydrofolate reductase
MKAIAAMDSNRGIGFEGKLPWTPIKEDFKWFRQKTLETRQLAMGRNTFQAVGVLKERFTYVITRDKKLLELPPFVSYRYVNEEFFNNGTFDDIWVCGGAQIYKMLLPRCTEVFVTHVMGHYKADTYMPDFEDHFPQTEIVREDKEFWIARYWK